MHKLEPPDSHHLRAAVGWLELGNASEARAELAKMSAHLLGHLDVLEVRWQILAQEKNWNAALEVASELIKVAPDNPTGWINRSYILHEMKRTREAWNQLLPVANKFPQVGIIPYNLACYACQLGDSSGAQQWLARAIKIKGKEEIKQMSLRDADLKPLWKYLEGL